MLLKREEARRFLVDHHGLRSMRSESGHPGIVNMLQSLRCIQIDPLEPLGSNADLVALARVEGIVKGDVYSALLPGKAFEHFCKERCLLPPESFPWYRVRIREVPWWRLQNRLKRLDPALIAAVLDEVRERGPISARDLTDRGAVKPLSWHGWESTSKATSMALRVLWTRCQIVVCGRGSGGKLYDVPERALPEVAQLERSAEPRAFWRWALLDRVQSAGLLTVATGPQWGLIAEGKKAGVHTELIKEGLIEEVVVEGSSRKYLAAAGFRDKLKANDDEDDGLMRLLGPLDPLIWDRKLVHQAFDFEYLWEVYKPKEKRRWGWYVCPLLHRGHLVGRLEGRVVDGVLQIENVWPEQGQKLSMKHLKALLRRHAKALDASDYRLP